ncbi:cyclase family protein [Halopelagius fulvigenes]|uniref:Cyclase family protein n=1 Tax=Halopelagius fulvigenes TaxID=1198324 RepID=A0ABD5TSW2_9EURY
MADWVDLTQSLGPDCPTRPPNRPAPEFESYADVEADGYNGTRLHLDAHCGTHMDAPTHFLPADEARTIDEVTPEEMVTEGIVLDFTDLPPGAELGREALESEADRRGVRAGDFVILDFGNPPRPTDEYVREYPYPSRDAAEFLVEREVACVATDALGVDAPGATIAEHVVHRTLLPAGVRIVEGVANLEAVEPGQYDVICTPIPYAGRDGSQVRLLVRPKA